jgi:LiaF transmembrane domain
MKKINYIFGLSLLFIGVLLILANFGVIEIVWYNLWPLFLLIPGIVFELSYFIYRKDDGNRGGIEDFPGSSLLVLGGILITYGLLFSVNVIYGWHLMKDLWPIFLLGVAVGLLQAYLFGGREKYLLIPVGILGAISLFFLINNLLFVDFMLLAGIVLVIIGIWIIFKKIK